jgi:hypothetical protein
MRSPPNGIANASVMDMRLRTRASCEIVGQGTYLGAQAPRAF